MAVSIWVRFKNERPLHITLKTDETTILKLKRIIRSRIPSLRDAKLDTLHVKYPFGHGVHLKTNSRVSQYKDREKDGGVTIGPSSEDPIEVVHMVPQKRKSNPSGSSPVTPAVSGDLFDPRRRVHVTTTPPRVSVSWSDARTIFEEVIVPAVIPVKKAPPKLFQTTMNYLSMTVTTDKAKSRRSIDMVTPFLTCLVGEFTGEAVMVANRECTGESVNAVFQIDYLLKRGDKFICVVESKKDDVEACLARVLFGCESIADAQDVAFVFGVVIHPKKWIFVRYTDERIEKDQLEIHYSDDGMIAPESVGQITGKLYGMLK